MLQSTTHKRVFLKIFSSLLIGATLVSCKPSLPTPPVKVPFGLGKGGESVEFDFRVTDTSGYVVELEFLFKETEGLDNPSARKAFMYQLGARFAANESTPVARVPITLQIRVNSIDVNGPPVNFEHITDQLEFTSAYKEFVPTRIKMLINNQPLQPGSYHIRVENLYPVPQFSDRKVRLAIHYDHHGK